MTGGRTTEYDKEKADEICDLISEGNSMRKIAAMDGMPAASTMFKWLREQKEFSEQYAHAKVESANADQDRLDEIAEGVLNETYEPQRARVAADIIKWAMAKKMPKKYGDRIHTEHSGTVQMRDVTQMTDEELEAELNRDE